MTIYFLGVLDEESEGVVMMVDLERVVGAALDGGDGYICGGGSSGDTILIMTVKVAR